MKTFNSDYYNDGFNKGQNEGLSLEDMTAEICRYNYWKGDEDRVAERLNKDIIRGCKSSGLTA